VGAVRFQPHTAVVRWMRLSDALGAESEQRGPDRATAVIFTDWLPALLAVKGPMRRRVPGAIIAGALFWCFGAVGHERNPPDSGGARACGVHGAARRWS
jgi:hypothetical protein